MIRLAQGTMTLFSRHSRVTRRIEFEAEALPHFQDLFRTAARLLNDPARADDVVQDVYLLAWKSFDRFETGTNCRAWLFRILFHSLQHYRRKWLNPREVRDADEVIAQAAASAAPCPAMLTDEEVLGALDAVSEEYRAVILLVDVQEFSYKETAEILGVPIGTVMSRLSRARKLLREHLARMAEAYGIGLPGREGKRA
jgi:RNA polymerase sigma-70 factor (ECF subfamily)